jgi:predicted metal-dependent HD superfamily phosphohydrolase
VVDEPGSEPGLLCDRRDRGAREARASEYARERRHELGATFIAQASTSHGLVVHPIYGTHDESMTVEPSSIPWSEVVGVGIRTTADGPFAEDVFWQLMLRDRWLELPGSAIDDRFFAALRAHLPGLAWEKVVTAMGSTEPRVFRVWHREDAQFCPGERELAERFVALVCRLGGDRAAVAPQFERLRAAWSAASRRYHGIEHLVDCLRELDRAAATAEVADAAELALWYHDAVHEPGEPACEARSAALLESDAATFGIGGEAVAWAIAAIRATSHTISTPTAPVTDLVLDIDLSILGRDTLRFMDYEHAIEEEYAPSSILAFRCARGRFLAAILARPQIFRTTAFRERYEQRARTQITALLASPRYRAYRWLRWLPQWFFSANRSRRNGQDPPARAARAPTG